MDKKQLNEQEIIENLLKAAEDEEKNKYLVRWDEKGCPSIHDKEKVAIGKYCQKAGKEFEVLVRKDMEEKGWIICRWANQVNLKENRIDQAKMAWNPFTKFVNTNVGFPDFIAIKKTSNGLYILWGVEVRSNGYLDLEEREKCKWMLKNGIFSEIVIVRKNKNLEGIPEYIFFREKYMKDIRKNN